MTRFSDLKQDTSGHQYHAQHIGEVLIDVLWIIADRLLISVGDIQQDVCRDAYDDEHSPVEAALKHDHVEDVSDHYYDEQIDKEVQRDPYKIKVSQAVYRINFIQHLSENDGTYDRKRKTVHQELIELPAFQFFQEIKSYGCTEEVIGEQEDDRYGIVNDVYVQHPCVEKGEDIRQSPHVDTKSQKKR